MLIVCSGMPRSGSTLQFNIAWKSAEIGNVGHKVEWRSSDAWAKADDELLRMARSLDVEVVKMHFPPQSVRALSEAGENIKFIYVHRDIFDVIYSMKATFNFSLSHAVRRVNESLSNEQWLLRRDSDVVLIQDYKSLRYQLASSIGAIAGFMGVELFGEDIAALERELCIDTAYQRSRKQCPKLEHFRRRATRVLGLRPKFADSELMLHPNHVSEHRGEVGVGRRMLSESEIAVIESTFGQRASGIMSFK